MKKQLPFFIASIVLLVLILSASPLKAAEPFGNNLLTNPSCDNNNYEGWSKVDGGSGWLAEDNVWKSSHEVGSMTQRVDLLSAGFTEEQLDASPYILAAGSFECPWSGGSYVGIAKINVTLLDASNNEIETVIVADVTYKANDIPWNTYTKQLQIPSGTRSLKFYFEGKDSRRWGGYFGPKFDNMWLSLSETTPAARAITAASVDNGSFAVDKATANAGELVKILVSPVVDYGLKAFKVTTSIGSTIPVTPDSTFIMPTGFDVTVSGEFWKINGLIVSCATVDNGSFVVDKPIANAGDTIKITVDPAADYGLKAFIVKRSDNQTITVGADSTFIMPKGYDVIVSGEFWKINGRTVSCATVDNGSFVVDKPIANAGEIVKITVNPAADYGLKAFIVKSSDNQTITVAADSTFIMPTGFDVTVSGAFWKINGRTVSCATVDNGSFVVDKTTANAGDTIKITVDPAAGYALKAFDVKRSDNQTITVAADSTFIMPTGFDVTVSGAFWRAHKITTENPFFEDFESGNLTRWALQSEVDGQVWKINQETDRNRTPYAGSYNATLRYSSTAWLFTPVYLHADIHYNFEMYARQDGSTTTYADITVMLGNLAQKSAMTIDLVDKTGLTNGDYTQYSGNITMFKSGTYVLGIKGYMTGNPYYISIDNIKMWTDQITSLSSADNDNRAVVYANARTIIVENANANMKIQVYDISGNRIANTTNPVIAVPNNGLYFVRVGDETHKVLLK